MINYQFFNAKDGAKIAYIVEGEGRPIIYFHGMGSSIESQMPLVEELKGQYKVIMFDQRSYGMTKATEEIGIQRSAKDGYELLEHLGIDKAVFLGYSMGASDIFAYLQIFGTEKIDGIIFTDMSPKLINEGDWKLGLYQGHYTRDMYEKDLELIQNNYEQFALILTENLLFHANPEDSRDFSGSAEEVRKRIWDRKPPVALIAEILIKGLVDIDEEHIKANLHYWKTMAGLDYRDVFEKIDVETLFIAGRPGSCYCPEVAEWMHERTANSQLKWIDGTGHMLGGEDRPGWVKLIKEFMG